MIDGLIGGKLYGKATERVGASGKAFVVAKVRAVVGDGDTVFISVIVFDDKAKAALVALDDGDSVALAGTLTPKVWTDRSGDAKPALDMVAHAVLSAYHVKRKRQAMQGGEASKPTANGANRSAYGGDFRDMQDDL
ncbi:Single-stranded DNA-binding protein [Paraburkholderia sacchari]|uniref:single-stranded DNA-binding protein n=1 Tax=Paraburkholderia sacchari TaxID=159450 RepID=UPI0039A55725